MSDQWPGVSARGVLDGEAGALAGLCDSRGASVVGYCTLVCGPERAVEAASAAFAAFRAGAVRSTDPLSIDPEALLLGRTRAAAAQRAPKPAEIVVYADIPCSQMPALLAECATGSASPADEDRLRRHLARCVSCRAADDVQQQAERAYFHPPATAVDPISRQEIIEALGRAVPPPTPATTAVPPPMSAASSPEGGNGDRPAAPAVPEIRQASVAHVGQPRVPAPLPRTVGVTGSAITSTPVGQPAAASAAQISPPPPHATAAPHAAVVVIRGHPEAAGPAQHDTPARGMPAAGWDQPTGVMSAVELDAALASEAGAGDAQVGQAGWAAFDPTHASPPAAEDRPGRRLGGARVFGPVAVLVIGLVVALFVAGVFTPGSHHPTASPLSGAQTDPSTAVPSIGAGSTAGTPAGGGSSVGASAGGGSSALPGATTAASRAAAKQRAEALARRLRAASGSGGGAATPKPTTTAQASKPTGSPSTQTTAPAVTTSPAATSPTRTPTNAVAAPTKPAAAKPVTAHELAGGGSARPVTGLPATGATGYQAG